MGNALRFLCGPCRSPTAADEPQELGSHGVVVTENVGVSALAQDLRLFDTNSRIPAGLSQYVNSSEEAQRYSKLLKALNEVRPPTKQPEARRPKQPEARQPPKQPEVRRPKQSEARQPKQPEARPPPKQPEARRPKKPEVRPPPKHPKARQPKKTEVRPPPKKPEAKPPRKQPKVRPPRKQPKEDPKVKPPEGVQFELLTLPIDERNIGDGDGFTAYVSTKEQRESNLIPQKVKDAVIRRQNARAEKDFKRADRIMKEATDAGYSFIKLPNKREILAHKYRIRLRGVDAPECKMPYGKKAKKELVKMIKGKCLQIHVYGEDKYGRTVGDVYCNGIFIQERLLKRGCAWHYLAFDARPEFAEWERKARADRRGLWALPNPEKPWVWKKRNPNPREN